jgi:DNA-binding NarL/FixJ family response regulator
MLSAAPADVLIAHPGHRARSAIRTLLTGAGLRIAGTTGDGAVAGTEAARLRPAVVLIDIRLATAARAEELARSSRVLLLTRGAGPRRMAALLSLPAAGYLDCDPRDAYAASDLTDAVYAVAKGLAWLSPSAAAAATAAMRASRVRARPG